MLKLFTYIPNSNDEDTKYKTSKWQKETILNDETTNLQEHFDCSITTTECCMINDNSPARWCGL